jgi:hypothetical protein
MLRHPIIREGVMVGLLGAAMVAAWFFVVDLLMGRPFYTPSVLGHSVMTFFGPIRGEGPFEFTTLYTVFHVAAFVATGIAAAAIMHVSDREPSYLAGLFIMFVVFELGFYFLVFALSRNGPFIDIAWYQIGAANLLAAAFMGRYLFRRHPGAAHNLNEALAGRT